MKRKEFNKRLRKNLKRVGKTEREEVVNYYNEMIDDRIESGKTEEEAIAELGLPEDLAKKTLNENVPDVKPNGEASESKNRGMTALVIALVIVCSPVLLSLVICAAAIALGLVVAALSVVLSVIVACAGLAVGGIVVAVYGVCAIFGDFGYGLMNIGGGLFASALGALAIIGLYALFKRIFKRRKIV